MRFVVRLDGAANRFVQGFLLLEEDEVLCDGVGGVSYFQRSAATGGLVVCIERCSSLLESRPVEGRCESAEGGRGGGF